MIWRVQFYIFFSYFFFFFNDTATTEIYTLSLHDALPIRRGRCILAAGAPSQPMALVGCADCGARRALEASGGHRCAGTVVVRAGHGCFAADFTGVKSCPLTHVRGYSESSSKSCKVAPRVKQGDIYLHSLCTA